MATFIRSPFVEGIKLNAFIFSIFKILRRKRKSQNLAQDLLLEVRLNAFQVITRRKGYLESSFKTL
jgi:hypothetical protein